MNSYEFYADADIKSPCKSATIQIWNYNFIRNHSHFPRPYSLGNCFKPLTRTQLFMTVHTLPSKANAISETFTIQNWLEVSMCGFFPLVAKYLRFCYGWFSSSRTMMISFNFKKENMQKYKKKHNFSWSWHIPLIRVFEPFLNKSS